MYVKSNERNSVLRTMVRSEALGWERTHAPACFDLAQIRHAGRVRSQEKFDS